jgi:trans-aconitate methyltransferase
MIKFAASKYLRNDCPNLEFKLMDMHDLQFEKEFDIVFSTATLHWVTDHLLVLRQIKKCLRPSGRMILQMGGKGNQVVLLQALDAVINQGRWQRYFKGFEFQYGYYSVEDYRGWLKTAGLIEKRVDLSEKDNVQNGEVGLCNWIRLAFSPYVQLIPEDMQVDFIKEIAVEYLRTSPLDEMGLCHIKMVRLEVEAGI